MAEDDVEQFSSHGCWEWNLVTVGIEFVEVGDGVVDSLVVGYVEVESSDIYSCQCAVLWEGGFFNDGDDVFGVTDVGWC